MPHECILRATSPRCAFCLYPARGGSGAVPPGAGERGTTSGLFAPVKGAGGGPRKPREWAARGFRLRRGAVRREFPACSQLRGLRTTQLCSDPSIDQMGEEQVASPLPAPPMRFSCWVRCGGPERKCRLSWVRGRLPFCRSPTLIPNHLPGFVSVCVFFSFLFFFLRFSFGFFI